MEQAIILTSGILTAAAAATVGVFLLIRKMVLVSDSMPHIALPGLAAGIIFNFNPVWGALALLLAAAALIWAIENKTRLAVESIVGVLFVTALAIGSLLVPEGRVLEAFFGSIENLSSAQAVFQGLAAAAVIGVVAWKRKALLLSSIAPDLARSLKINVKTTEFLLLLLISVTVAIGINFVGILLMSGLLIVPAIAARNLTSNLKNFFIAAVVIAVASVAAGILFAPVFGIAPGILTVLTASAFFLLSLFRFFFKR